MKNKCCNLNPIDLPSPPQNIIILVMTGYNYRTIPEWFDSTGQKMFALQFSVLYDKLYYRWTFYKQEGNICDSYYRLSTSDDIMPVIIDEMTSKKMNVSRAFRHNGYTLWDVSC